MLTLEPQYQGIKHLPGLLKGHPDPSNASSADWTRYLNDENQKIKRKYVIKPGTHRRRSLCSEVSVWFVEGFLHSDSMMSRPPGTCRLRGISHDTSWVLVGDLLAGWLAVVSWSRCLEVFPRRGVLPSCIGEPAVTFCSVWSLLVTPGPLIVSAWSWWWTGSTADVGGWRLPNHASCSCNKSQDQGMRRLLGTTHTQDTQDTTSHTKPRHQKLP